MWIIFGRRIDKDQKPNSCAAHNFLIVSDMLITNGRDIDKDHKRCRVQEI